MTSIASRFFALLLTLATGGSEAAVFEFTEVHMGLPVRLVLHARDRQTAEPAARAAFATDSTRATLEANDVTMTHCSAFLTMRASEAPTSSSDGERPSRILIDRIESRSATLQIASRREP